MRQLIEWLGMAAAIIMPLWNIPLILHIRRRRSSRDISLSWTLGVFVCIVVMLPSALVSSDNVFRVFTILNTALFGGVVFQVLRFRNKR